MISPWVDISEINGSHWVNFWKEMGQLFASGGGKRQPWLIVFHEGGTVIRAQVGDRSIPSGFRYPGPGGLRELARAHGARRALGIEAGALPRLWAQVEGQVRYGDDILAYAGYVLRALKKAPALGMDFCPPLRLPPVIPPRVVFDQLFNLILPNDCSLALYVMDEGQIFTSMLLRKNRHSVTHLTTDDGLEGLGMDPLHWREEVPRVSAEIARRLGPLWAAVFCERRALAAIVRGDLRVQQAIDQRLLICNPWPARWSRMGVVWKWFRARRG